jgi:CRP-like cAMP-binding protein
MGASDWEMVSALAPFGKSMPKESAPSKFRNRLLAQMTREQLGLIEPALEAVPLQRHKSLETRDRKIEYAYFIESGLASVVANERGGESIEVGVVGNEGMTGLAMLLNSDRTPLDTLVQIEGTAQRIRADKLRAAMDENRGLNRLLTRYAHVFMIQAAFTALANGRHSVEERLARWLLMAHDRAEQDDISMTHALLAVMLGVRRPGVTVALNELEQRGLIQVGRGIVTIIDRTGLEIAASGIYGRPEAEYRRLFR